MQRGCLVLCAVLLLPGPALAQQVYKCKDRHGRTAYSQVKPRAGSCEGTEVKPAPKIGTNVEGLLKYSQEIDKTRAEETQARQETEQQQAARQGRCNVARAELAMLQQAGRVFYMDEKGERHYQDDAQRQALIDAAQQRVAGECG